MWTEAIGAAPVGMTANSNNACALYRPEGAKPDGSCIFLGDRPTDKPIRVKPSLC
jgi:hypothetical protein